MDAVFNASVYSDALLMAKGGSGTRQNNPIRTRSLDGVCF
jgi:hypothetical protein